MTTTRRATSESFAVYIHGDADQADLIVGKVYRVMRPQRNDRTSDVRIVDESGEDYLYPRDWFVPVDLPLRARKAIASLLPAFHDDEEERRFWETHNFADYFGQMRPVRVQVSKKLRKRVEARKTK